MSKYFEILGNQEYHCRKRRSVEWGKVRKNSDLGGLNWRYQYKPTTLIPSFSCYENLETFAHH